MTTNPANAIDRESMQASLDSRFPETTFTRTSRPMSDSGPIYGTKLIERLPIGGGMYQAMPNRYDLQATAEVNQRTAAGYEVLLAHFQRQESENQALHKRVKELDENNRQQKAILETTRCVLCKVSAKAERVEEVESWMEDIAHQIGCGHIDEALPSCTGHYLDNLQSENDELREQLEANAAKAQQSVEALEALLNACDEFREAVLNDRHQLSENGMTCEQTNDVLGLFDDTLEAAILAARKQLEKP